MLHLNNGLGYKLNKLTTFKYNIFNLGVPTNERLIHNKTLREISLS